MLVPNLIISEVYPHPSSNESEWIEIYNPTDEPIDLSGLSLYEHISQTNLLVQFTSETESLIVQAKSFYVYQLESNKLNNSEELITLENRENIVIDSFAYKNSKLSQSFNKDISTENPSSTNIYLAQPTPNEINYLEVIPEEEKDIDTTENIEDLSTTNTTKDTSETENTTETSNQIIQPVQETNSKLLQYQQLTSELKKFPNTQKVKSEKIKPRESKFSYLVQKHVSVQGVVNAIIGGSLLLVTGFLL